MATRIHAARFAGVLLLIASALVWRLAAGVSISTDIREILPTTSLASNEQATIDELQQPTLSQHMLLLGHTDRETLFTAVAAAQDELKQSGVFKIADWPEIETSTSLGSPYIFRAKADENLSSEQLVQRALQRFYGFASLASGEELMQDPFGLVASWRAQQPGYSPLAPMGPCLYRQVDTTHWCLLPLQGLADGMHLSLVESRVAALNKLQHSLRSRWPDLQSLEAGVSRHAHFAARTAKQEFSLISSGTGLGILVLVLVLLGSLKPLLSCLLMLSVGALCGLTACLLVFPQPHLIALVFGACLLGVGVDYAFHFLLCPGSGQQRISAIRAGLNMGWLSTSLGFAMLLLAPFDSLRQLALFGVFGLAGAWASVVWLLPLLSESSLGHSRLLSRHQQRLAPGHNKRPSWLLALLLLVCFGGFSLTQLQGKENVRALHAASAELLTQDGKARQIIDGLDAAQLFIVRAVNDTELLNSIATLDQALNAAQAAGQLRRHMAISQQLPTITSQQAALAYWQKQVFAPSAALDQLQQQLNLPQAWIQSQREAFQDSTPISLAQWGTKSGPMQSLLLDTPGQAVSLIRLGGIRDLAAMKQIAAELRQQAHDIDFFDPLQAASSGLEAAREQALGIFVLALGLVLLVLCLRYGLRAGLISALPLLAGLSGALSMLLLRGQNLTLFAIFALLLVTGMAIDYGVFLREAGEDGAHSLLAVLASATTTLLAFGLLSFSSTPALRDFGQLVASGIFFACLSSLALYKGAWLHTSK